MRNRTRQDQNRRLRQTLVGAGCARTPKPANNIDDYFALIRLRWLQQCGWFFTWFTQVASLPSKNHLQGIVTTRDLQLVDLKTNSGSLGWLATSAVGSSGDLVCTVACREGVCVQERWTGVRHRCEIVTDLFVMFRRNMMMLVPLLTSLILTKLFTWKTSLPIDVIMLRCLGPGVLVTTWAQIGENVRPNHNEPFPRLIPPDPNMLNLLGCFSPHPSQSLQPPKTAKILLVIGPRKFGIKMVFGH